MMEVSRNGRDPGLPPRSWIDNTTHDESCVLSKMGEIIIPKALCGYARQARENTTVLKAWWNSKVHNELYTWWTYIALAIWTGWLFRVLPQWGVLFFPFYSSKEKRGKRRITDGMERKEESGRWGSMSISPYMSVIKTTKRLVIHFYPGRTFDSFHLDSISKCQYN